MVSSELTVHLWLSQMKMWPHPSPAALVLLTVLSSSVSFTILRTKQFLHLREINFLLWGDEAVTAGSVPLALCRTWGKGRMQSRPQLWLSTALPMPLAQAAIVTWHKSESQIQKHSTAPTFHWRQGRGKQLSKVRWLSAELALSTYIR